MVDYNALEGKVVHDLMVREFGVMVSLKLVLMVSLVLGSSIW